MNPLITKYLNNQLSETEEEQLIKDLLKVKFDQEYHRHWSNLLKEQGIQRNDPEQRQSSHSQGTVSKLQKLLALAAMLTVFLLAWQFLKPASLSEKLASHLQKSKPIVPVVRLNNEIVENKWEKTRQAYQEENYVVAAQNIEDSLEEENGTVEQYYYLGLAYLYQKPAKADLAIRNLLKARENNPLRFKQELQWYLGMAYLHQKDWSKAKEELQPLVDTKDWNAKEAAQLLNSIPK